MMAMVPLTLFLTTSLNVDSAVALNTEAKMRLQIDAGIKVMKKVVKC